MSMTTRPELQGTFGMVASTHWIASQSGMRTLELGGNAFDAAVTAGFVLQVVEPHLNGLGGEVPILVHQRNSAPVVICGQGTAPSASSAEAYRRLGLSDVPGTGHLSACVPGAFDAWMVLLRDFGSMSLRDVLTPAIEYAADGYPVVAGIVDAISGVEEMFRTDWPTSAAVYLPGGRVPRTGERLRNPALAMTFERLLAEAEAASSDREGQIDAARHAFYSGFVAEAIEAFVRIPVVDTSGRPHAGLLTAADMSGWSASTKPALTFDYAGFEVCKTPPWGQGPVFLQQLAILSGFDIAGMGPDSADFVHVVIESAKLAFADREAFYGDPEFCDVPMEQLLSPQYNDERRKLVDMAVASLELRPGSPNGQAGIVPRRDIGDHAGSERVQVAGIGEPTVDLRGRTRGDTCHVDVVDRFGNMVSCMPSGGWLMSSPVVPELGLSLSTRGQMFVLDEGLPNTIVGGKRPRTTLSPGLVLRDGAPYMAFGSPGGDQQDQWALTMLLRHIHHNMNLQQVIDAPMFHTTHFPSSFWPHESYPGQVIIESRFTDDVIKELRRRGHAIERSDDWSLGRLSAVTMSSDGLLRAGANPRGMQGYAVGR